jgi:hypothetical protein
MIGANESTTLYRDSQTPHYSPEHGQEAFASPFEKRFTTVSSGIAHRQK